MPEAAGARWGGDGDGSVGTERGSAARRGGRSGTRRAASGGGDRGGGGSGVGASGAGAHRASVWLCAAGALLLTAGLVAGVGARGALGPSLRLRVIAASNAAHDQRVKLAVRNAVLDALAPTLAAAPTNAAAVALARARLGAVAAIASTVAARFGQRATVRLGPAPFPAERIGWLAFPAGRYPAVVVRLGAARGHNWWTVLFPPLAFVTVGGRLAVVGPSTGGLRAATLSRSARATLLRWIAGRATADGPDGFAGKQVQVRFALWELARAIDWRAPQRWLLAWAGTVARVA